MQGNARIALKIAVTTHVASEAFRYHLSISFNADEVPAGETSLL